MKLELTASKPIRRKVVKKIYPKVLHVREWHLQRVIFDWAKIMSFREPRLALLNASMNGLQVSNPGVIVRAKLCGLKPGFPDINLPVRGLSLMSGLYIELKAKHDKWVSGNWDCCAAESQRWWRDALRGEKYRVEIAHGVEEAINIIADYLQRPDLGEKYGGSNA